MTELSLVGRSPQSRRFGDPQHHLPATVYPGFPGNQGQMSRSRRCVGGRGRGRVGPEKPICERGGDGTLGISHPSSKSRPEDRKGCVK